MSESIDISSTSQDDILTLSLSKTILTKVAMVVMTFCKSLTPGRGSSLPRKPRFLQLVTGGVRLLFLGLASKQQAGEDPVVDPGSLELTWSLVWFQ